MERDLWTYSTVWPHSKEISTLTPTQEKTLSLLPIVPSLLSIWGSGQIIYMVITTKKKTPYRRILLGLSCCDLFSSICLPLQPFLIPEATSLRIWAVGNERSCNFLGWAQQFFFSSLWYNGMLSVYFLLTVKYGVKDPQMAKYYEPWMHIFSVGFPLVTATAGLLIGLYRELGLSQGCWINRYPEGCGCDPELGEPADNCCTSHLYGWAFAGLPALIWFFVILGNNVRVYCYVRSTISRGRKNVKSEAVRMSFHANMPQPQQPTGPSRRPSRRPSGIDRQAQRIRAVATQAFYYVGAFLICYVPSFAMRVCEAYGFYPEDEHRLFPLLVLQTLLLPSQGLFNLFVYVRPAFNKARRDYPNEKISWAFRRAMFGDKIKPVNTDSLGRPASTQFNIGLFPSSLQLTQTFQRSFRNLMAGSGESSIVIDNDDRAGSTAERPTLVERIQSSSIRNLITSSDDEGGPRRLFGRLKRNLDREVKDGVSSGDESGPSAPRERPPNSILKDKRFVRQTPSRNVSFVENNSSCAEEEQQEVEPLPCEPPPSDPIEERRVSWVEGDSSFSEDEAAGLAEEQEQARRDCMRASSNRMIRLGDLNSSFSDCGSEGSDHEDDYDDDDDDNYDDDQF